MSSKTVKPTSFNFTPSVEERKEMQKEFEGKAVVIKRDEMMKRIRHTIKGMGTKDVCFTLVRDVMMMSVFNNDEMKDQMILWKDLAKKGKLNLFEENKQMREIDGKKYHLLTITPCPNAGNFDPVGMALGFMVSGYIYVFRQEKNRDAVYNYIKKYCKEEEEQENDCKVQ
jgi:hypothetical protein